MARRGGNLKQQQQQKQTRKNKTKSIGKNQTEKTK